jgi:hypothetical protein
MKSSRFDNRLHWQSIILLTAMKAYCPELAQAFSCDIVSVTLQIHQPKHPIHRNGEPRLVTFDGYTMTIKLELESFQKKQSITIGELIDQSDNFWEP